VDREREIAAFDGGARYNVVADFRVGIDTSNDMVLENVKLNVTYPNNDDGVTVREFLSHCAANMAFSVLPFDAKMRE
jgi:DNA topoisomerase-1